MFHQSFDIVFKPRSILLDGWIDEEDGEIITSCVLEKVDGHTVECKSNIAKLKGPQKVAFDCLLELFESSNRNTSEGVHIDVWREVAYTASISPTGTPEANRKALSKGCERAERWRIYKGTKQLLEALWDMGQGQDK